MKITKLPYSLNIAAGRHWSFHCSWLSLASLLMFWRSDFTWHLLDIGTEYNCNLWCEVWVEICGVRVNAERWCEPDKKDGARACGNATDQEELAQMKGEYSMMCGWYKKEVASLNAEIDKLQAASRVKE